MGRFDPKYSPEQREAVTTAQVDGGVTSTVAAGYARDGKYEGLEPFEVPAGTAGAWASHERARRRGDDLKRKGRGSPEQRLSAASERLLGIFEAHVEAAEARAKRSRRHKEGPKPLELERLRKIATLGREVMALHRGVPVARGGGGGREARQTDEAAAEHEEASTGDPLVDKMLRETRLEPEPARRGRPPQQNGDTA